jgi:hypothetical protein
VPPENHHTPRRTPFRRHDGRIHRIGIDACLGRCLTERHRSTSPTLPDARSRNPSVAISVDGGIGVSQQTRIHTVGLPCDGTTAGG